MTALLTPLVIAPDATVQPVDELSPELRAQLGETAPGDRWVGRARSRSRPILLGADAVRLLSLFREERTVAEAVIELARQTSRDAAALFEEALPVILRLYDARVLVPASEAEQVGAPELAPGARVGELVIERALQLYDDSEVYAARGPAGRVALKLGARGDPRIRGKLETERLVLEHLAGLRAPRVVAVERGERPHLALEWLEGEPSFVVAHRLRRAQATARLHELCARIAEAYADLHAAGVVHGDVHPGNVMVDPELRLWLIDFGIARFTHGSPPGFREPEREGVPFFFEPEYARAQLAGARPPPASVAGEQFGLAALLHYLLTGHHYVAFAMEHRALYQQIVDAPPALQVSGDLGPVLTRALAKAPGDRFESMAAFAAALRAAIAPAETPRPGRAETPRPAPAGAPAIAAPRSWSIDRFMAVPALDAAPTASVMFGAAGAAYALLRAARVRDSAELLAAADQWSARAATAAAETAYLRPDWDIRPGEIAPVSLHHGRAGVDCVRALIAHARGDLPRCASRWPRSWPRRTSTTAASWTSPTGARALCWAARSWPARSRMIR